MPTAIRAVTPRRAGEPAVDPTSDLDPFTATAPGARHAAYSRLAERGPVHRIALPNGAPVRLVTGHDEVRALLDDPRLRKAARVGRPRAGPAGT